MRYGFDESGGFAFPTSGFDSCAVGAVACPDSALSFLEAEFARLCGAWGYDEIHAAAMTPAQLHKVSAVIGVSDVVWAAVYTDTRLLPIAQQEDFRRRQVDVADRGIANSATLADDERRKAQAQQTRNRIKHATRVGAGEYLEFLMLLPRAIGDILAGSLRAHRDARWGADLAHLRFESDRKLTSKLSMGEKTLAAALPYFMANNDQFTLDIPATWSDAHPFLTNHRDATLGTITVARILGPGIEFVDSASSPMVQAADVIAHVARRAAAEAADTAAQTAYRLMRRRGFCTALTPIRIFSLAIVSDRTPIRAGSPISPNRRAGGASAFVPRAVPRSGAAWRQRRPNPVARRAHGTVESPNRRPDRQALNPS